MPGPSLAELPLTVNTLASKELVSLVSGHLFLQQCYS